MKDSNMTRDEQQPQPLAGGDAGFWEFDRHDEALGTFYTHGVDYEWSVDEARVSFKGEPFVDGITKGFRAQAAVEAHKAAQESPEPEAGFWVAPSRGKSWAHHENYSYNAGTDEVLRAIDAGGYEDIGHAKTKEEAQRLVEQDMERRDEEQSPAKAARPCDDDLASLLFELAITKLSGRQDADAARIAKLEKRDACSLDAFRVHEKEIKALEKRVGLVEEKVEAQSMDLVGFHDELGSACAGYKESEGAIKALEKRVGELEAFNKETAEGWAYHQKCIDSLGSGYEALLEKVEALEAKAKDPEPVSEPYKLPYAKRFEAVRWVLRNKSRESATEQTRAILQALDKLQPQPASEPCGVVDWVGLESRIAHHLFGTSRGQPAQDTARAAVAIVKAHLANCGEGGSDE